VPVLFQWNDLKQFVHLGSFFTIKQRLLMTLVNGTSINISKLNISSRNFKTVVDMRYEFMTLEINLFAKCL